MDGQSEYISPFNFLETALKILRKAINEKFILVRNDTSITIDICMYNY